MDAVIGIVIVLGLLYMWLIPVIIATKKKSESLKWVWAWTLLTLVSGFAWFAALYVALSSDDKRLGTKDSKPWSDQ